MQGGFIAERPLGYGQFAAGAIDTAVLLSTISVGGVVGIPAGTAFVRIVAEAQAVRWRDDGTAPTATIGQPLASGAELLYTANGLKNLQFISQTAGAILNCTFYAQGY